MKKIANMRVFPTILTGMIVGISFIILTDLWLPASVTAVALIAAVGFSLALYKKDRKAFKSAITFCVSFALGVCFGLAAAGYANAALERKEIFAENVTVTGKIEVGNSSDLTGRTEGYRVVLTDLIIDGEEVNGKAEFYSLQLKDGGYFEGDVITFVGDVKTLTADITTPYKASALADGVVYDITCADDEDAGSIEVTGTSLDFFDKIKKAVAAKLADNVPDDTARFMYAMLFGDSSVIEENVKSDFSYTGTAHLLAVSGLHVGMIAGALFLLLKAVKANAYVRGAAVIAVLLFFCALCGFSPSTVRATIMVSVGIAAGLCGLRYDPLSGMSFAAIILLFVSPYNLYSLGFLMSFLAVYGLILFARPLRNAMTKAKFPKWLASALSATLAANATLLPLMIYVFGDVSLIFALSNCIIVPLAGIFFPLYVVMLPFSFIPYFGVVATAASLPFTAISALIKALAGIDFPSLYFNFDWATIILWTVVATAVSSISGIPVRIKKISASVLILCFLAAAIIQNASMLSYENKLTCFSSNGCVGVIVQSESEGDFIVFDGEFDESAAEAALEAMEKNRLRKVDFIVKYEFSAEESLILKEYLSLLGAETVYTDYAEGITYSGLLELTFESSVICTYNNVSVYLGGTDMLVTADVYTAERAYGYDVIVCPFAEKLPEGTEYLVSETAYIAGGKNCLPSDFTFWTEGDRIIKTNKWRFA